MNKYIEHKLIEIARKHIKTTDASHDVIHSLRVLANVKKICEEEGGDLDILVPAALFHDVVNPPKNSPKAEYAAEHSAAKAEEILEKAGIPWKEKI